MLDDLVSVIETLQQRIREHGATLRENETRTRMALIDPLLSALGWDVSDPSLVTPEYNVGNGRADYALHGSEPIPAAIVEAKRLGHALNDDERMQMLNYANARGVRYAAVTDGDVWELYEVFKQAPLEDRRLLRLRIFNTRPYELALQLLMLWRPNLASGQPIAANEPILVEPALTGSQVPDTTSAVSYDAARDPSTSSQYKKSTGSALAGSSNRRRWAPPDQPDNLITLAEAYQSVKTAESEQKIADITARVERGELKKSSIGNMKWSIQKQVVEDAGFVFVGQ